MKQCNLLKVVIRLGSTSCFSSQQNGSPKLSVLVFADAARPSSPGQLGWIAGLLAGPLAQSSLFHPILWASHLSKRPVKSSASVEFLAASAAIDEGKVLANAYQRFLQTAVELFVVVDSKDLFHSLSTNRAPEETSIAADIQLMRCNFGTRRVNRLVWIPGRLNLADPLTKTDSLPSDVLQLMFFSGLIPVVLSVMESRESTASLG